MEVAERIFSLYGPDASRQSPRSARWLATGGKFSRLLDLLLELRRNFEQALLRREEQVFLDYHRRGHEDPQLQARVVQGAQRFFQPADGKAVVEEALFQPLVERERLADPLRRASTGGAHVVADLADVDAHRIAAGMQRELPSQQRMHVGDVGVGGLDQRWIDRRVAAPAFSRRCPRAR